MCEREREREEIVCVCEREKEQTLSLPELIPLVHDWQEEVLIPVPRREDNGVIQEDINGIQQIICHQS